MKKFNWLFVILMALATFSCQKPEGDLPGNNTGDKDMIGVEIKNSTAMTVWLDSTVLADKWIRLESLTLKLIESGADTAEIKIIKKDTALNVASWRYHDTIWSMKPNTTYSYQLTMIDLFSQDTMSKKFVTTMNPGIPKVDADSARNDGVNFNFYGTATTPWRAMKDINGIDARLGFRVGVNPDDMGQELNGEVLSYTFSQDSVRVAFVGSINVNALPSADTVWFQAHASNGWGINIPGVSDPLCYTGQHVAITTMVPSNLTEHSAVLNGNTQKGVANDVLTEHGFYFSNSQESLFLDGNRIPVMENLQWNSRFNHTVENLVPGAKYYYCAYLRINGSNEDASRGQVAEFDALENVYVNIDEPMDLQISDSSIIVTGSVEVSDISLVDDWGFLWKKKDGENDTVVNFDNMNGDIRGTYVPEHPDRFWATVGRLESQTEYLFCSYVQMKVPYNRPYLSETIVIKTK